MCGIALAPDENDVVAPTRRGPDEAVKVKLTVCQSEYTLFFNRLRVFGGAKARQPVRIRAPDGHEMISVTNGELYNHKQLDERIGESLSLYAGMSEPKKSMVAQGSLMDDEGVGQASMHRFFLEHVAGLGEGDCRVVPFLIALYGAKEAFSKIRGVFASVTILPDCIVLARDLYGVRPLYFGHDAGGRLVAVSTPDCLLDNTVPDLRQFPPGKVLIWCPLLRAETWYSITPPPIEVMPGTDSRRVAYEFYEACRLRCGQNDVGRLAVLLSGGMDSSVVLAMACHFLGADNVCAITGHLRGAATSDVAHARKLCRELGVKRHLVIDFDQVSPRMLRKVIRAIGSWDTTTVRASAAQMLMLEEAIRLYGPIGPVVLSGEGADEVGQGYQHFKCSKSAASAEAESERLLNRIHYYDALRADRTTAHYGLEVRLPFLDTNFVQALRAVDAEERWCGPDVEKRFLRELMATEVAALVPELQGPVMRSILQRPKEALSDSVGGEHVVHLQALAEGVVSDYWLKDSASRWPHCSPITKEEYMYRQIYDGCYGVSDLPAYWSFGFVHNDGSRGDPSATHYCFYNRG